MDKTLQVDLQDHKSTKLDVIQDDISSKKEKIRENLFWTKRAQKECFPSMYITIIFLLLPLDFKFDDV